MTVPRIATAHWNGRPRLSSSGSISEYTPAWISVMVGSTIASRSVEVPAAETTSTGNPASTRANRISARIS